MSNERRICRGCSNGFYWPPLADLERVRNKDLCLSCDRLGNGEPDEPDNPCTVEDMLEADNPCDSDFMEDIST